jgi:hypothetical protein
LAPFNLAVEVGRAGLYRPEFNANFHKIFLDLIGEKLSASIRLDSLNWEMHFFKQPFQKIKGVRRSSTGVKPNNHTSSAVIHGGVLIKPRSDFAGIHLHPFSWDWTLVAIPTFPPSPPFEGPYLITRKDLVDGCQAEMHCVVAVELIFDTPGSHAPLHTKR